jgi:hypothetical protein
MANTYNVFISWSGARSKMAAEALREWLRLVLQRATPWMSDADIDKGSRGLEEVGRALEGMKVGIICLTPENLTEPWILYEAGALSKTLDAKTRVCTYLLGGLQWQDVKPPLGLFQATAAVQEDTRKLVHTVNKVLDGPAVADDDLDSVFDGMWPKMKKRLEAIPAKVALVPHRSTDEMITEVLELSRFGASNTMKGMDAIISAVGEVQRIMADVAAQVPAVRELGQGVQLVGSAVEELSEMLSQQNATSFVVPSSGLAQSPFAGLGRRRFFRASNTGVPLSSLAGDRIAVAKANLMKSGAAEEKAEGEKGSAEPGEAKKADDESK